MADGTQEGRCGSKHRKQRTVTEKLDVLLVLLDVLADDSILKKVEGFENHPKAKGTSYTTAIKWAKPEEARRIRKAAAKEHACTLLRIDKEETTRRVGKFFLSWRRSCSHDSGCGGRRGARCPPAG